MCKVFSLARSALSVSVYKYKLTLYYQIIYSQIHVINKGVLHLENLGKVMDSFIKENPTHFFFGDNGLLMSLEKLAKVNGLGIFDIPSTAFVNGLL